MIQRAAIIGGGVVAALATLALAATPPKTNELMDKGWAAFVTNCVPCHGAHGEGNGPLAFWFKPPPRNFKTDAFKAGDSVEQIYNTVTNGLPSTMMAGFPKLPDDDRWGLAYVVHDFRPQPKP